LWKRLCERDFTPIKNALAGYFGKNWRWVYRSKVVIFKGRGQIKDGDVGTLITKDGRYEGEWYVLLRTIIDPLRLLRLLRVC
jgi:hypothetical protein